MDKGSGGTDGDKYFVYWIKEYVCPVLGEYELGESRSVILMDNTSTHLVDKIVDAMRVTDAILIYSAPYSPHLNPIELYFVYYKVYLKRNNNRMLHG